MKRVTNSDEATVVKSTLNCWVSAVAALAGLLVVAALPAHLHARQQVGRGSGGKAAIPVQSKSAPPKVGCDVCPASLLVVVDADCSISVDRQDVGRVAVDKAKLIKVGLGEHSVAVQAGKLKWETSMTIDKPGQHLVKTGLQQVERAVPWQGNWHAQLYYRNEGSYYFESFQIKVNGQECRLKHESGFVVGRTPPESYPTTSQWSTCRIEEDGSLTDGTVRATAVGTQRNLEFKTIWTQKVNSIPLTDAASARQAQTQAEADARSAAQVNARAEANAREAREAERQRQANDRKEKLKQPLLEMKGNWEQTATDSKSWGTDCSGTIKLTRTLSLNEIDEDKPALIGTYTREAQGKLNTSSTVARALRAGPDGRPETCVFQDYNEGFFYETRTYDVTVTCSSYAGSCWLQAEETNCSGTCINHERTLRIPIDGSRSWLSAGEWRFSRR